MKGPGTHCTGFSHFSVKSHPAMGEHAFLMTN